MPALQKVAVIGGGNLGNSIARGLISAGLIPASSLAVTRRRPELLAELAEAGVATSDDNLAAQTARGAASQLLEYGNHPETEIDKVTTPKGCTIYGLNEMENRGFSSAMIRGIITASEKAGGLYQGRDGN